MTAERTEGAALSGTLTLTVGGRARTLPVLKIRQSKEWKERLGASIASVDLPDDGDIAQVIGRLAMAPAEVALDLLLAYDRSGVLGGREAIEEEATDAELFDALARLVKVTYPFETGLRSVAEAFGPQLRSLALGVLADTASRLARASSTPTPSGTGGSTPTPSTAVTPTNSSSSSGPTTSTPRSDDSATSATWSPTGSPEEPSRPTERPLAAIAGGARP